MRRVSLREGGVTEGGIAGLKILIVEDEALVLMLIEDVLEGLGCTTAGTATRLDEALEKASALAIDLAILDVNLNGQHTAVVAQVLQERGVPFLFATGYGPASLPDGFRNVPVLQKPFREADLERAVRQSLALGPRKA